jgi:ribosomal-protein-alanine N-acetyltransferase
VKLFGWRDATMNSELKTARLLLVPITPALLEAEHSSHAMLAAQLAATVPAAWPPADWDFALRAAIHAQITTAPDTLGWHRYSLFLHNGERTLIGCIGAFPKHEGAAELGYSTLSTFQRRGFATEAASAFLPWLLQQPGVRRITAQSYLDRPESIKVMQRSGMIYTGEGDEPGTARYLRER